MGSSRGVESGGYEVRGTGVPWGDVLLSGIAAVSWALIGMAGTAALGLHLLEADSAGSLGPMTAAVVALGAGGSVTPSGDVSAFGLKGAAADTAIEITPLGVSLVGALLLSWFFLRSLRAAGVAIAPAELLARAGAVVALFVATLGGLAWAGHDVITIDGGSLGLDDLIGGGGGGPGGGSGSGSGGGSGGLEIPGLGDVGDIGGLLPDRLGDLVDAKAAVGFTVDTVPTLLGGLAWSAGILLIALLASRRTPLPRGWEAVHRVVRPAASALVTVLLMSVAAGFAAAGFAAISDDHPKRIAGAALLGAPNGTWLGIPIGLLVPWDGRATGQLVQFLPDPLDDLLSVQSEQSVTLGRLAELDGRVWLLGVAAALMMLLAGVLVGVRTPVGVAVGGPVRGGGVPRVSGGAAQGGGVPERGAATGLGAGRPGGTEGRWGPGAGQPGAAETERGPGRGRPGAAAAGRGPGVRGGGSAAGVLGFAGRCGLRLGIATALTLPLLAWLTEVSVNASLSVLGFDAFGAGIELCGHLGVALFLGALWGAVAGAAGASLAYASGAAGRRAAPLALRGVSAGASAQAAGAVQHAEDWSGPYAQGTPYRPPNRDTNPYLRVPAELREPEDARPPGYSWDPPAPPPDGSPPDDVYGAPTVVRPIGPPPPRSPGRAPAPRPDNRPTPPPDEGPPPPPPLPPRGKPKNPR
ncbi:streptophobe family protein [Streptomyces sp. NPDC002888]|uniref:streptophobe family protein n=1 Tax=Streptomyces sp. NPDC002888 TaxID=3364668 RepID=UPI003693F683